MTDELNILIPDRTLTICGVQVTVHEYTLAEQLQHRQPLKAISEGFMDAMNAKPDAEVSIDELYDVLGANWDAVLQAVAVSCGRSVEWVAGLTGDDSESLLLIWWGVNAAFLPATPFARHLQGWCSSCKTRPLGRGLQLPH